jgi:acyl carrier protein phosphodiesterase
MNYLAHAYLSFNEPEILTGNLISDFVKGKKKFDYSQGIQKGISLHRAIDNFTDTHVITKQAKEIFRPHYRLYAGAFVDVVYDHFLGNDATEFEEGSLAVFAENTYQLLEPFILQTPDRFQRMFPYMKEQNWLNNYKYKWGIAQSLAGVVKRSAYLTEADTAFTLFEENYSRLKEYYTHFFPLLKKFVIQQLTQP